MQLTNATDRYNYYILYQRETTYIIMYKNRKVSETQQRKTYKVTRPKALQYIPSTGNNQFLETPCRQRQVSGSCQ